MADYYGIDHRDVKVIIANGATRINPMLDVYNSFYANQSYKPIVHVLYDDDDAGRSEYDSIKALMKRCNSFTNIDIKPFIINNYAGKRSNNGNYEIEDLMYPEVICYLLNTFLLNNGMNTIETTEVLDDIVEPRYINDGILKVCDIYTGQKNKGINTSPLQPGVKGRMCELFDISNSQIKSTLDQARIKHSTVEEFVQGIFKFE